jgi:hypothetical protein
MVGLSIPRTSAPILDILLRAGLCTLRHFESMKKLDPVERDETFDAISQGALPLPQLTWEWAGTHGHVPLLHPVKDYAFDTEAFNDDLLSLTKHFTLQVSLAYNEHYHDEVGMMLPFPGQRVKLTNRTNWISIGPPPNLTSQETGFPNEFADTVEESIPDSHDEADSLAEVPNFFAPALRLGATRAGETWVRIHPDQLSALKREPCDLIALLATVSESHMQQVRETVKTQAGRYERDAAALDEILRYMSGWETLTRRLLDVLNTLPAERRRERASGGLQILTTLEEPPAAITNDPRVGILKRHVKELDVLTSQPEGASMHDILRWHDRTATYIRTTIGTSAAEDFEALRTTTNEDKAAMMREALRALHDDVGRHPEHYRPSTPPPNDTKAILIGWFWALRRPWKILIATIILLTALLAGTWKLIPEAIKVHLLTRSAPHASGTP